MSQFNFDFTQRFNNDLNISRQTNLGSPGGKGNNGMAWWQAAAIGADVISSALGVGGPSFDDRQSSTDKFLRQLQHERQMIRFGAVQGDKDRDQRQDFFDRRFASQDDQAQRFRDQRGSGAIDPGRQRQLVDQRQAGNAGFFGKAAGVLSRNFDFQASPNATLSLSQFIGQNRAKDVSDISNRSEDQRFRRDTDLNNHIASLTPRV